MNVGSYISSRERQVVSILYLGSILGELLNSLQFFEFAYSIIKLHILLFSNGGYGCGCYKAKKTNSN